MAKIVFFCHDTMENIHSMEYYRQDIEALRQLGHDVDVCNRYRDIPFRFDAIFIWWWTFALLPVLLTRLTGRTAIVTGVYNFRFENQLSGVDYFSRPWFQRVLIGLATRLASANIFVSRKEFEVVPPYFGLKTGFYAPLAVGDSYFASAGRASDRTLLLNLAWSGSANLKRKGVWTILEAASLLKERGCDFDLILAGKRGDGLPDLRERIVALGLTDCVTAIGEVTHEEKLDLFARTKVYLQPSYFEGFGLATAEAMAAGCCVITTDAGEVRTVVGDEGLYVEPGDAAGLAATVESLLSDPQRVSEVSGRAITRMRTLYSTGGKRATLRGILAALNVRDPTG